MRKHWMIEAGRVPVTLKLKTDPKAKKAASEKPVARKAQAKARKPAKKAKPKPKPKPKPKAKPKSKSIADPSA